MATESRKDPVPGARRAIGVFSGQTQLWVDEVFLGAPTYNPSNAKEETP
jgi:hypothetical protein